MWGPILLVQLNWKVAHPFQSPKMSNLGVESNQSGTDWIYLATKLLSPNAGVIHKDNSQNIYLFHTKIILVWPKRLLSRKYKIRLWQKEKKKIHFFGSLLKVLRMLVCDMPGHRVMGNFGKIVLARLTTWK